MQVIEAANTGIWKGRIDSRVGLFHFNYVDMITESTPLNSRRDKSRRRTTKRSKPRSVEELLQRIGLEVCNSIICQSLELLNGHLCFSIELSVLLLFLTKSFKTTTI